jgi:hypothetical protein
MGPVREKNVRKQDALVFTVAVSLLLFPFALPLPDTGLLAQSSRYRIQVIDIPM